MSDIAQEFGIVEQGRMMRNFLHRFTRKAPLLSEYASGPRALVNLKTGERVIEATAEQAAKEEARALIAQRMCELVDEAIEKANQKSADVRTEEVSPPSGPLICEILAVVTSVTGISTKEMVGPRRERSASNARHFAFWLIDKIREDLSLPAIGRAMKRDHTTIMHGRDRVKENLQNEPFVSWLAHDAVAQLMKSGGTP